MKTSVALRRLHYWGSALIALQMSVIIVAGVLLLVKKDFAWIQPPTQRGVAPADVPQQSFKDLFLAAQGVPELALEDWDDLSRVDVKPGKGVVKFVAANNWEAQVDTHTGEVVQVAFRRSDIIEQLHDGSFFGDGVKRFIFLPTAIILLGLWGSGLFMFIYPRVKRRHKRRRRNAPSVSGSRNLGDLAPTAHRLKISDD